MSLRSPRFDGFKPLSHNNAANEMGNIDEQGGIPLTTVATRSSSTGARKPGEGAINDFSTQSTMQDEEKKGFFRAGGGKRKVKKFDDRPKRMGTDGEEVAVNGLGRFYNKIINFSIVTRYLVYVAPVALLIAAPIIVYALIGKDDLFATTNVRVVLFWTWIEIVWLSIWISKLVSKAIPFLFMFLCGVVSSGTRKYASILQAVELPLSFVGWAVTALVTFTALTQPSFNNNAPSKPWIKVMKNILGPALIASLLYLGEKFIIQLISINYHRRSFDGRIKDSKRNVHLLGLLYEASRTLFPMYCDEFIEEDYIINDSIEAMLAKSTGRNVAAHRRSGSATPLRLIGNIGRVGDKVTSVFGNIASEITGKQVFNPNSAHSVVIEALEKTKSSEALAKRLWMSFVVEGKEALYAEDIYEVLGPARKTEAEETFYALDNDGNGDISLDEMIMKVVDIGRDRKSINASMRDVGQAIGVLDSVLITVLFVIVIFIFVAFQDTNFVTTLATAGTTLLSLSFVFAATTQEFLGSCIFLFIKHPYDVGDRVDIVGPEKEYLIVEQISLLFTVFKRIDQNKMVQVPNIILNNLWVENITRSKAMKEQLDMFISFDTTLEDIETLRAEMEAFVRHPDNSRDFQNDIILEATGIGSMDKLQLKVEIRHKSNWHNETIRAARRSKFMCALVLALRKVPIYAPGGGGEPLGGPTNPGYSVAISDDLAAEARDKAKVAKEAKRLIPTPIKSEDKTSTSGAETGEAKAAELLNRRRPVDDSGEVRRDSDDEDSYLGAGTNAASVGTRQSMDRGARSSDIEELRAGLLKRESTRGRRRPGEVLSRVQIQGGNGGLAPSMSFTAASPRRTDFLGRSPSGREVIDEESGIGLSDYDGQGYGGGTQYAPPSGPPPNAGYGMFPPAGRQPGVAAGSAAGAGGSGGGSGSAQPQQGRSRKLSLGFKDKGEGSSK